MKSKSSKQTLSFALIAALFLWAGTGLLPLSRSSADTTLVAYAAGGKDSETSAALQAAKQEQLNNTEIRSFDGEKTYTNSLLNPESKYIFNGEGSAQPSYEADNTENAENAEKDATAIQPKTGYADPSGKTAKDYSYEIVPLLAPFNEYFLVKTEKPDPTSFRFKDKKSIYCNKIFPKCRTIDCSQTGLFPFYDDHENAWIQEPFDLLAWAYDRASLVRVWERV